MWVEINKRPQQDVTDSLMDRLDSVFGNAKPVRSWSGIYLKKNCEYIVCITFQIS